MHKVARRPLSLSRHLSRASKALESFLSGDPSRRLERGTRGLSSGLRSALTGSLPNWLSPETLSALETLLIELEAWTPSGSSRPETFALSSRCAFFSDELERASRELSRTLEAMHDVLDVAQDPDSAAHEELEAARELGKSLEGKQACPKALSDSLFFAARSQSYRDEMMDYAIDAMLTDGYRIG